MKELEKGAEVVHGQIGPDQKRCSVLPGAPRHRFHPSGLTRVRRADDRERPERKLQGAHQRPVHEGGGLPALLAPHGTASRLACSDYAH